MAFENLPGGAIVGQGLVDLAAGTESVPALLASIAAAHLQRAGIEVPPTIASPNRRLYQLLERSHGDGAHSQYNALIRRLVSFQHALACAK